MSMNVGRMLRQGPLPEASRAPEVGETRWLLFACRWWQIALNRCQNGVRMALWSAVGCLRLA